MQRVSRKRRSNNFFVSMITVLIFVVVLLPTTTFAANFWQGGEVYPHEIVGTSFNTGSDNKLTVSAAATVSYGNPESVTIKLQKNVSGGYVTVKTVTIPTNGVNQAIIRDHSVDKNTTYRFAYSCQGNSGANAAYISMGIGTWN